MKHRILLFVVVVLLFLATASVAGAVTNGEPDSGNTRPYVGLMVAFDSAGNRLWRCSGTLLSSTVFLTAGHCTESPAYRAEIWFDWNVEAGIPGNGYPNNGPAQGLAYTHPEYNPNAFFVRDVGMVILDNASVIPSGPYPTLPAQDELDQLATRRGRQDVSFTAVGYGLQRINPVFVEAERVRYIAHPNLVQINTPGFTGNFSILLTNNHSTGGTCFGDSGGPNFIGNSMVVGGVTSFGLNGNCAGTGGVFRMDRAWARDWVLGILGGQAP